MGRILILYDEMEPPVEMMEAYFSHFSKRYHVKLKVLQTRKVTEKVLNQSDLVILIRSQSMRQAEIAKLVSNSGRMLISSYDDDFLALKDFYIRRRIQAKAVNEVLRNTDILLVSNDGLGKKYAKKGHIKRYFKLDTGIQEKGLFHRNYNTQDGMLKVVYYCSDGSTEPFESVVGPMLPAIAKYFGDNIEWILIGVKPAFSSDVADKNVHYIEYMSLEEFRKELRKGYSFGIAPLPENEFSRHKYFNKFLEFSMAGLPCVYSKVPPYTLVVENGVTGILCSNSAQEWINAFQKLSDWKERKRIGINAQNKLREDFSEAAIMEKMVHAIPEMLEKSMHKKTITKSSLKKAVRKAKIYECIDPFSKAYGRLRIEGMKSLLVYTAKKLVKK